MKNTSIIIVTYNRPKTLLRVIDSYLIQKNIGELIIINDGSNRSYNELDNYCKKKCLEKQIAYKYHKNKINYGAGYSRNIALKLVKCKYILWGEDDLFLNENYLEILLSKIEDNKVLFGSIYYGIDPEMGLNEKEKIKNSQKKSSRQIVDYQNLEGYYRKEISRDIKVPFGHAIILVNKKSYDDIKYFEGYKVNGYREETDAQIKFIEKGIEIIYTSDTECYHLKTKSELNGGQHSKSFIYQEFYTILNNNIFLDRNYKILKNNFSFLKRKNTLKLLFIISRMNSILNKINKKILAILRWGN